jgi:amino acid adenylation domain-containing protein
MTKPELTKPELAKPELTKPELTTPEPAKPEAPLTERTTSMPERPSRSATLSASKRELLERRLQRAGGVSQAIERRPDGTPPPLSRSQERMWFAEQLAPGTAAYSIGLGCRLRGDLDVAALGRAATTLAGRHESLRMRFPAGADGAPVVVIDEPAPVDIPLTDLTLTDPTGVDPGLAGRERRATDLASELVAQPWDLAAGPLLRASLIRIAAGDHALVLVLHHIISDGWSAEIIMRELLETYQQLRLGVTPALPDLPVQFGDYAVWERSRLAGTSLQRGAAYWQQQLADVPPLDLAISLPRPAEQSFTGAAYVFELDAALTDAIAELGRGVGGTMYMTLMAAFEILLARHSGQYDFAIGSPVAGRPHRELEGVVGSFVNMLTVRARLAGDPSFREVLTRCRDTVLDALTHQDVPFDQIVTDLKIERDPSRSPLFQVTFALDNTAEALNPGGAEASAPAGLTVDGFSMETAVTQFDLALYATQGPAGLSFGCTYRSDLFDGAVIEQLAARLRVLLTAATRDPDLRLSELPIMTEAEQQLVLHQWPGDRDRDRGGDPGGDTLTELVEAQAARTPDEPAVVLGGESLTHAELDWRAGLLARRLRGLGARPDAPVAICLPQSLDLAVAILAVLKSGSPYLPLDPEQPQDRLEYILADAGAVAVVTSTALRAKLGGYGGEIVDLDAERAALAERSDGWRAGAGAGAGPGHLAYVIYTSGTTGRPKGVAVEHRSIAAYLRDVRETLQVEPGSTYALLQSLAFDFSLLMFYLPLVAGGCLHLLPQRISGHDLADAVSDLAVDYLKLTPSHLAALASDAELARLLPRRALVLAGEAAPAEWARSVAAAAGCAVVNSYGPTETVVAVTTHQVAASPLGTVADRSLSASIGRPMPGVRAMVLDDHLRSAAPRVAGELYVGGDRLARGYLGRPALTAERFVADPFGPAGGRLYRTGDRVRWRDDGTLEFLGRTDHQVKIRGYRVELGEIEAALADLPGVTAALADLRGPAGRQQLVGYLDLAEGAAAPADADIHSFLAGRLPEYMVPARVIALHGFPRQAHGKVDRKALPDPDADRSGARTYVAPRTEAEQTIADIWRQILELDQVGVHDNFFELGGHSLLATRVVAALRRAFDGVAVPISVMDMFKYPTVAQLAAVAATQRDEPHLLYELTPPVAAATRTASFVCAPYGGAHASVYQKLAAALPADCSLYGIEVPGRDIARAQEALPVDQVAETCVAEILRDISGPLVIYGHCGPGGALAVAIAQGLEAAGRQIDALYLGGVFPFARPTGRILGPLSRFVENDRMRGDRNHANWLRGMGSEIADLGEEQVASMVAAMRQDGRLAEAYFTDLFATGARKLRAPVISVVGGKDPGGQFYQERFKEWGFLGDPLAAVVLDEAGHFFVQYRAAELAEILTRTHRAIAAGAADILSADARGPDATWWLHDYTVTGPQAAEPEATEPAATRPAAAEKAPRPPAPGPGPAPGLKRFTAVALSQLVSITGSTLTEFALPLWIYLDTGSLARFGLLAVLGLLPGIAIGPLAGALVDRYDRRRVMIAGDLAAGITQAVLLVLAWTNTLQLWHLYVLIAVLSVALAFQRTAYLSAIPQIVPKRYLGHANGMVQTGFGFAQFIAPLIGVGLLATVHLRGILAFDVASYLVAIGVILLVRFPVAMAVQRAESVIEEIRQGFRFTLTQPSFRAMILFFAALNLFLSPLFVLLSPLVLSFSNLRGVAEVAFVGGLGGVVAGLTMTVWGGPQTRRMATIRVAAVALAAFAVLTGLRANLVLIDIGAFGMAFSIATANGIIMTIIQTKVPQRLQGRIFALNMMIASVTVPIGFGVIAPYGTRLLNLVVTAGGPVGSAVRATLGGGPGRGIGLLYIACGLALALLALTAGLVRRLAQFDRAVPDARPDDLLGLEEMSRRSRGHQPSPAEAAEPLAPAP